MATVRPEIHILHSVENGIVLAHAHDEMSHHFIQMLLDTDWPGDRHTVEEDGLLFSWSATTWEGQAVFPLEKADDLVQMARFEGIEIIDGPTCLPPEMRN